MSIAVEPPVENRPRRWASSVPRAFLNELHKGTTAYTYRGVSCLKSPFDLALYMRLLFDLRPKTLIEIGTHHGGSALFFADQCQSMGLGTTILSLDAHDRRKVQDPRVRFIEGDARDLWATPLAELDDLPRPWLVIEDSAHTPPVCDHVLRFFRELLFPGDVMVMEDGILNQLGLSDRFHGGPIVSLKKFMLEFGDEFEIMTEYADFFGNNVTYSPNGWLRRI